MSFAYHFKSAMRGLRRNPLFTVLMELSLGFGVALFTVGHTGIDAHYSIGVMQPGAVYHVEMTREMIADNQGKGRSAFWDNIGTLLVTYHDALAIADATRRPHTISFSAQVVAKADASAKAQSEWVSFTTAPLFDMFSRRFVAGQTWSAEADTSGAAVAVVTETYA